jgi:hypothetical protein
LLLNGSTLDTVAVEQTVGSPTRQDGSELPPEIYGVSNAGVEPVAAPGWVLMGRIPDDKEASVAIGVSEEHPRLPRIGGQYLNIQVDIFAGAHQRSNYLLCVVRTVHLRGSR